MSVGKRYFLTVIVLSSFILSGCASSDVSRNVSSGIDNSAQGARNIANSAANSEIAETYQNASQASKGAVIGGATGAVAGLMSSSIGFIPGVAVGSIMGGSYGAYIDSKASLPDRLENRGATIVVLGDQILIVIPSERLFDYNTADIKPQAYSTLQLVADYINTYVKMTVKISAFTNASGPERVNLALTQQQAESVSKALQMGGVNARLLYAVGYGGTNLVEKNSMDWEGNDNYRIEITLEKQYV